MNWLTGERLRRQAIWGILMEFKRGESMARQLFIDMDQEFEIYADTVKESIRKVV